MATVQNGAVLRQIRVLFHAGSVAGLTDAQLLERFTARDSEVAELAFAAIVERHGPMVLRVCRQTLGDLHDAQDAFQATFFILARKARSVRRRESLASWLHGVAHRVCLRARSAKVRRRVHEHTAATLAGAGASGFALGETSELGELIHEELARLPERFRAPILLCDLEDVAYEEAARVLGCPIGTVKSRLARGREKLRLRLALRGLAPLAGIPVAPAARASVPTTLRDATAHAATRLAMHGPPAVGIVSAPVASLTNGVLQSMILFRLKIAASVILVACLGTTAAAVLARSDSGEQDAPSAAAPARPLEEDGSLDPVISAIRFEGKVHDTIKRQLVSRVGQPLDLEKVEADLKTLMKSSWFSDVTYSLDESPPKSGKYTLIFTVTKMPVFMLTKVEFKGLKLFQIKEIEYNTDLKAGKIADPTRTLLAVDKIRRLYLEKGYNQASVTLLEGGNPGDTNVVIEIFEGPKHQLRSIDFEGNHFATDAQLMAEITREPAALGRIGLENILVYRDQIEADRESLVSYYKNQGFLKVDVRSVLRTGDKPGDFHLTYLIQEKTRYRVGKIDFLSNKRISSEKLREGLLLQSGRPFLNEFLEEDKKNIIGKYKTIGCGNARIVHAVPRFTRSVDLVDLTYKIEEVKP
ncbi:MAG: sigma-70 family RNA polymerase sigma factor [Isosphaerales bacterium]